MVEAPRDVIASERAAWQSFACQKTRTAASEATGAVNSMLAEELTGFCHSVTYDLSILDYNSLILILCQRTRSRAPDGDPSFRINVVQALVAPNGQA